MDTDLNSHFPEGELLKKREGALGTKVRGCSFLEGDASHTAQGRPLALRIEERSKDSSRNKHLQCSIKETRTYRKVIDMDQTALLTNCSNLRESIRRKQSFRSSLPKNLPVLTASESVQLKNGKGWRRPKLRFGS